MSSSKDHLTSRMTAINESLSEMSHKQLLPIPMKRPQNPGRNFTNSRLMTHRRSRKYQEALNNIIVKDAVAAVEKTEDYLCRAPPKKPEPLMPSSMMSYQRKRRQLYMYMKKCVESGPVVPIQKKWLEAMLKKVPLHLRRTKEQISQINQIFVEVTSDYEKSIRKSMVQHVLLKPNVSGLEQEEAGPPPKEPVNKYLAQRLYGDVEISAMDYSSPWHERFVKSRAAISNNLWITHSSMQAVLQMCQTDLQKLLMVDLGKIRDEGPLDIEGLKNHVTIQCDRTEERLMQRWYPRVINVFVDDAKFTKIRKDKLDSFYACVTTLLSNQLKDLVRRSLYHWMSLFESRNRYLLPMIKMELTYDDGSMDFFPTYQDLEDAILYVTNTISESMHSVPTIQSWLSDAVASEYVNTDIDERLTRKAAATLKRSLKSNFKQVQKHLNMCAKKYGYLVDGDAAKSIEQFMDEEHTFEEYCAFIEQFREVATEIKELDSVVRFSMVRLDCGDLKHTLVEFARQHSDTLLNRLARDHRDDNESICLRFEEMKERCLKAPEDTEEIMEIMEFVNEARATGTRELNERIKESHVRLDYLLDVYFFSPEDIDLNSTVLTWPQQIGPIFEENDELIENAKLSRERELLAKRERVTLELEKLSRRAAEFTECGELDMMQQYVNDTRIVQKRVADIEEQIAYINKEEGLFKWDLSTYPVVDEIQTGIEPYQKMYGNVLKWQKAEKKWMDGEFLRLDSEVIEAEVDEYWREVYKANKTFSMKEKKLKEMKRKQAPRKKLREDENKEEDEEKKSVMLVLCEEIMSDIKEFKRNIPLISTLCNPGIRKRHWIEMSKIYEEDLTPDAGTTLRKMLKMNLENYMSDFEAISSAASKEFSLEKALTKMKDDWAHVVFHTSTYRDSGVAILSSLDEIQTLLEDQIVKTQTMRGSPFIKPFEEETKSWEEKLLGVQDILDEWLKVQAQWLYLEPIFSSEDIMHQMPEEGRLFQTVDQNWKEIMKYVFHDPHVMAATSMNGLLERFIDSNAHLEKINKGLNAYLEKKRLFFSRFFFLSNDEMLEILSETKDPTRVQPHLKKCFEGIAKLEFLDNLDINAMFSSEGEKVELVDVISTSAARGQVEKWLLEVEDGMLESVRDVIIRADEAYPLTERHVWVTDWPGQVVLYVSQMHWTSEVHDALQNNGLQGLKSYVNDLQTQLGHIVNLVRGKLSKQTRITLGALVTIDVHARDVIVEMISHEVSAENDFNWLAQLRYYWQDDEARAHIINADVKYAYEYLGNSPRLVITPLTDRCYRTLVGAFHLNLGGAPEGPAGTGKTETTKDLAKALAVQVDTKWVLNYVKLLRFTPQ